MKHSFLLSSLSFLLALPVTALAHETQQLEIGDQEYKFVVGSLNEPLAVDDKSGVDLTVSLEGGADHGDEDENVEHTHEAEEAAAVLGLESTLKVEVSAGGKARVMDLAPQYGKPGSYKAVFIPTIQTTLTYRFFGTINDVPVDLSFTCNPAGHPQADDDMSEVAVSEGVTRTLKRGAFGCPARKDDLGFPEPAPTLQELGGGPVDLGLIGAITGLVGLIAGVGAWMKRKQ